MTLIVNSKTPYAVSSEPASTGASLRALFFFIKTHKKHKPTVVHGPDILLVYTSRRRPV